MLELNDNKWFTQTATGDVPSPRRASCAGVVWAADRSSFNLYGNREKLHVEVMLTCKSYVWGGIGETGDALEEAYILTLPSFQWIRVSIC